LTAGTIVDDVGDAHLPRGGDLLLPAASVPGIIDDALQFSGVIGGTGPRLTLPSGALPNINPLTIALWLKPAASVAMTLLDFGPLVLRHDGTKLHLTQGFSTTGGAWSKTCPLTAGQWTHLAVTYTRQAFDEAPILWRNAVDLDADEDAAPSGTIVSDAAATKLLGNNAALGEPIHGALDDVRLYSRELAPHELAALTALATIQP
ncbi:MAG TPA: LamG domain-containing protein, partial [Lacipirellulaceae bacterium]|nr:LamG domain-containing protein [Lacipirellulaceae bacterium]